MDRYSEPSIVRDNLPMKKTKRLGRGLEDFSHLFLSSESKNKKHVSGINQDVVCEKEDAEVPARPICIISDKGIAERSFLTVNLALDIANQGKKVLVFDADFSLPRLCMLLGVSAHNPTLHLIAEDGGEGIIEEGIDGVKLITLDIDISDIHTLSESERNSIKRCFKNAEEEAEILLINISPGFMHNMQAILESVSEIIMITPQPVAEMINAYGIIKKIFQVNGDAHVGIVSSRIGVNNQAEAVFEKMQRIVKKFLDKPLYNYGYIPDDREISLSLKRRRPLVLTSPSSKTVKCVTEISQCILGTDNNRREESEIAGNHFSFAEKLFGKSTV